MSTETELTEPQKLFLAALTGDEYTQGHGCLVSEDDTGVLKHCCLGVATDLFAKTHPGVFIQAAANNAESTKVNGVSHSYLPQEVASWLGIVAINPHLFRSDITLEEGASWVDTITNDIQTAAHLNDSRVVWHGDDLAERRPVSFKELAPGFEAYFRRRNAAGPGKNAVEYFAP